MQNTIPFNWVEKRDRNPNLGRKMMRMRNLRCVCAKIGRSEMMMRNTKRMMNAKGRRCYSTVGEGGDSQGGLWGALGIGWRTLARGSAFYFGYKFFGEYLRPYDHQYLIKRIEEADSDMQTYLDRIKIAERSLDAVLKLEDKCFGPKH